MSAWVAQQVSVRLAFTLSRRCTGGDNLELRRSSWVTGWVAAGWLGERLGEWVTHLGSDLPSFLAVLLEARFVPSVAKLDSSSMLPHALMSRAASARFCKQRCVFSSLYAFLARLL